MTDVKLVSDSHLRSIAKGLSWRLGGSLFTAAFSFGVTGSVQTALIIGGAEVTTKLLLFWAHERIWARIVWGRTCALVTPRSAPRELRAPTSHAQSVAAPTGADAQHEA